MTITIAQVNRKISSLDSKKSSFIRDVDQTALAVVQAVQAHRDIRPAGALLKTIAGFPFARNVFDYLNDTLPYTLHINGTVGKYSAEKFTISHADDTLPSQYISEARAAKQAQAAEKRAIGQEAKKLEKHLADEQAARDAQELAALREMKPTSLAEKNRLLVEENEELRTLVAELQAKLATAQAQLDAAMSKQAIAA